MERRIFISSPRNIYLEPGYRKLKQAIITKIKDLNYEPQYFNPEDGGGGLAKGISWSSQAAEKIMKRCVGAVLLGFPYWTGCIRIDKVKDDVPAKVSLVTEYCQYEGALALQHRLPILAILEKSVEERLVFLSHGGDSIIKFSEGSIDKWLETDEFNHSLTSWDERVKNRKDVFLGYSGGSRKTAGRIKKYLADKNIKVLDWYDDFTLGDTIIAQIRKATETCTAAIFLFTKADKIKNGHHSFVAVPRDNVLFETGYFINAKGKKRVLIIVEKDTKVLADLGGVIYVPLEDKNDIKAIEEDLDRFIEHNL